MTKILFICYGNICRSPTAEYIMRDMVEKAGLRNEICVSSAATSDEEIGSGVYPPMKKLLTAHGIDCSDKRARQITPADYGKYDLIIYMDELNRRTLNSIFRGDPEHKLRNLLDYAGRTGEEIADPWYTRQFQTAWDEIYTGCEGLLKSLTETEAVTIDFSACLRRGELYKELRRRMAWEDWYGETLDSLWDVLTGLPHKGDSFELIMPPDSAPADVKEYAARIKSVFEEAGVLAE